jgi:glucokinase
MDHPSDPVALVADIGGTNARFALATRDIQGRPLLTSMRELTVAQFDSMAHAAVHYLEQIDTTRPRRCVIAVASAVTGDEVKLTNNTWSFSIAQLQRQLGFEGIEVINDFAAIAMAIPHLTATELAPIGDALVPASGLKSERRCAVMGAGTGLGVCGLLLRQGHCIVIESEGGHVAFAPGNEYEIAVLQFMMKRHVRVSIERLVSGPGLQNLYAAVCALEGTAATRQTPESITAGAKVAADAACQRAVELFCSILGSFAGDVALTYGAWDGVYLGGGMTTTLLPWICSGEFRQRFENKGRCRSLMQKIPTSAICHAQPGLLGACARALDPPSA